jgi:hypothetical protein
MIVNQIRARNPSWKMARQPYMIVAIPRPIHRMRNMVGHN